MENASFVNAEILLQNQQQTVANKGSPIGAGSYKHLLASLGKAVTHDYESFVRILESEQAVLGDNMHRVPQVEIFSAKDKASNKSVMIMKMTHRLFDQLTLPYERNPVDNQQKCFKYISLVQSCRQENIIKPERVIPVDDGVTYFVYPSMRKYAESVLNLIFFRTCSC